MKFQEVLELVPGTTYKIVHFMGKVHKGTYVGTDRFGNCFKNESGNQYMPYCTHTFYKPVFQKEKIQSDMEHRALQVILKSIIGDSTFSW